MIINIISWSVAVIAIGLTIYYGKNVSRLQKAKKTLTWHDLEVVSDSLTSSLKRDDFMPEVILVPGLRGGIIAELLLNRLDRSIPVLTGVSYRDFSRTKRLNIDGYEKFEISDDWDILIPKAVFNFKEKRILIVDDFCLTGEFFQKLRQYLLNNGFHKDKIRGFYAVITNVTKSAGRVPDYYSFITEDDYFYFPWGKAGIV